MPRAVTVRASGTDEALARPDPYNAAARTLYRTRRGNVLLTGRRGVGKATFVRELARRAATGEIPFLTGRRFVWIDCRNVGPEDSRACLESIFTAVATTPDVVLCLDGLAALLKRTHGGTNKPLLRAMLGGCTTKARRARRVAAKSEWHKKSCIRLYSPPFTPRAATAPETSARPRRQLSPLKP